MRWLRAEAAMIALAITCGSALAQDLPALLSRFQLENDRVTKERTLMEITGKHPDAGAALLKIARERSDDAQWMAIRGIGYLKYRDAVPFLEQSLSSRSNYVRANAARALGEIGDSSAVPDLIRNLKNESDSGVIEQTALAFQMLRAKQTVPVLKAKAKNPSAQTRLWVLGAIETLGSTAEIQFIADFLNDQNVVVAADAAHALERLTGQDFGFPKCGESGPCSFGNGVENAQQWWKSHSRELITNPVNLAN